MRRREANELGVALRDPTTLRELVRFAAPAWPEPTGYEIRRLLTACGIPDEVVAVTVGISDSTLNRWTKGLPPDNTPEKVTLLKVVRVVTAFLEAEAPDVLEWLSVQGAPGLTPADSGVHDG